MPSERKPRAWPDLLAPYFTANLTGRNADFKERFERTGHATWLDRRSVVTSRQLAIPERH
jgi:hypothetical protein